MQFIIDEYEYKRDIFIEADDFNDAIEKAVVRNHEIDWDYISINERDSNSINVRIEICGQVIDWCRIMCIDDLCLD